MFDKAVNGYSEQMFADLAGLVAIPSISCAQPGEFPYGKNVDDALSYVEQLALKYGFEAENKKYLTEVCFGKGSKKVYIACHADVVPVGKGWDTDPFCMVRKDGKLFGRGVTDNKGSVLAVLYAFRVLKDAGYTPDADVRLLVGGAEETGMDDLPRYMKEYGYPDYGLTPDSTFPIVNTEAGMFDAKMKFGDDFRNSGSVRLVSMRGGVASNCVPDFAEAVIEADTDVADVVRDFLSDEENTAFMKDFEFTQSGNVFRLTSKGINAHASVAYLGKNALTDIAVLINSLFESLDIENRLTNLISSYFANDYDASKLGLTCHGDILGDITLNVGYCDTEKGFFTIDMRIPVEGKLDFIEERYVKLAKEYGFEIKVSKKKEYTNVPEDSEFMQKLGAAFEHVTGRKAEYLGSCGLTYAKVLGGKGVAFGPAFDEEGHESGNIHADNEFIREDVLVRLASVYAQVISELWC